MAGLIGTVRTSRRGAATGVWTLDEQVGYQRQGTWIGDADYDSVSLLLHMDGSNGGTTFTDSSKNAISVTANGNAQISTAQSKFGGASALFDGSGDWITASANSAFSFGTGDFTVELFARWGSFANYNVLYDCRSGGSSPNGFVLLTASTGVLSIFSGSSFLINSTALSINTWYHVACTRSGSTLRLFIDGTQAGSATFSGNLIDSNFFMGKTNESLSNYFNGYIDDLRVTKGVARYTANFTVPSNPFPNS